KASAQPPPSPQGEKTFPPGHDRGKRRTEFQPRRRRRRKPFFSRTPCHGRRRFFKARPHARDILQKEEILSRKEKVVRTKTFAGLGTSRRANKSRAGQWFFMFKAQN